MRKSRILFKNEEAGSLIQKDDGSFVFCYDQGWIVDANKPSIALTLPKIEREFHSKFLFPFFYNMLPEGSNKMVACRLHKLDPDDFFGLLLSTAKYDSIGAIQVIKV